jgi:hypothetical protein
MLSFQGATAALTPLERESSLPPLPIELLACVLLSLLLLAVVLPRVEDTTAHCRWEEGVMECWINIVYPPAAVTTDDDDVVVGDDVSSGEATANFRGRFTDENSASHGFNGEG